MDLLLYTKYLVVLVFVLGIIALIAYGVRKFGFIPTAENHRNTKRRLAITQMIALDGKRRLVLVRRDDQEHLLLLGPDGDLVVEPNIPAARKPASKPKTVEAGNSSSDPEPAQDGHQEPKFSGLRARHIRGETEE